MLSKEYSNTAGTLLRIAQNMTDPTIADRLKALAQDYERRAEKASHLTPKPTRRSTVREIDPARL
jgi:hypothetical protein